MTEDNLGIRVRNTRPEDFGQIIEMSRVYPHFYPWTAKYLQSHIDVFPEGQFVAVDSKSGRVVGMAASLIVLWDDYNINTNWFDITGKGMFNNHDPEGHTLYGAEVMVRPSMQGRGVGKRIYKARRELAKRLRLLRIRAGGRLPGYHKHAFCMSAEGYVRKVIKGELKDPVLSFQLREGFRVIAVVPGYLPQDRESHGYAAIIEWINPLVAKPEDYSEDSFSFGKKGMLTY
ncbi:MAG TPA: GNAT family N-acetyltransferase [Thermodesulfobacteriota bacterium]|nr:GNAT family N-acetyltransferase [Thermodesulfobacteriota bacterium]